MLTCSLFIALLDTSGSKVEYIAPATFRCSCDWNKERHGWIVKIDGHYAKVEGDRKDGKSTSIVYKPQN